jgi:hypothetical protein
MKRWLASAALVFAIAVAVNYLWELAQSPLYLGQDDVGVLLWHCLRAAVGDGVLVLVIFAGGALVMRRPDWFVRPGKGGYLWMLSAGLVIGVVVEWLGVHVAGRWAYGPRMPLVPGLEIGVVPVLQMLLLPPLIFRMASAGQRAILRRSGAA